MPLLYSKSSVVLILTFTLLTHFEFIVANVDRLYSSAYRCPVVSAPPVEKMTFPHCSLLLSLSSGWGQCFSIITEKASLCVFFLSCPFLLHHILCMDITKVCLASPLSVDTWVCLSFCLTNSSVVSITQVQAYLRVQFWSSTAESGVTLCKYCKIFNSLGNETNISRIRAFTMLTLEFWLELHCE